MSLRQGLAPTLRAIRVTKGLAQSDLASAAGRTFLSRVEQAKSDVTLGKLEEIAAAVGVDAVTLILLCSVANGKTPEQVLKVVESELAEFRSQGGLENLTSQAEDGAVASRIKIRFKRQLAVQECRNTGMSQRETAERLQLPKSTVADLWNV
ncbi:helix-turn-helix transcriptional regulator [Pseudomonas sp. MS-1(2024)]|uniref:helix-turn-helix domain-containing protein n=1 Tax=Pseudomonas sp. MS-1(2024) TaxID=3112251 RepID=UPI002DB660A2|nr:helix-turn-helix transcriptional regulator [Pseudomonas sp. MS-1(2024)]MEC4168236.1 helix-turn-helix transcriptional regulator [Pseudomonas sp. MS-1(2024)]